MPGWNRNHLSTAPVQPITMVIASVRVLPKRRAAHVSAGSEAHVANRLTVAYQAVSAAAAFTSPP